MLPYGAKKRWGKAKQLAQLASCKILESRQPTADARPTGTLWRHNSCQESLFVLIIQRPQRTDATSGLQPDPKIQQPKPH